MIIKLFKFFQRFFRILISFGFVFLVIGRDVCASIQARCFATTLLLGERILLPYTEEK